MRNPFVFLLILLLTTQCRKEEPVLAPNIAKLIGKWQLVEPDSTYAATMQLALDTDHPPHDITPFIVNGKSSVNAYEARLFAVLDGTMTIDQLSSTQVAGPPQSMTFEQTYFNSLTTVARFELPTDHQLRLHHGGEKPGVLVYKKIN